MRQAGRYLPEYRKTRKQAGSFLDLCYNPALATEVTLQPIRRFGFDAAILFSDILVIPDALGQPVRFEEGRGPVLEPITAEMLSRADPAAVTQKLSPVFETVDRLHSALPEHVALIGFCGAPWTVATYMIAGHGTPDQGPARRLMLQQPEFFAALIDVLVEASINYLNAQIDAGAEVVQIFDTWAGILTPNDFDQWVIEPTRRIVDGIRASHPEIPVIGFPKGSAPHLGRYVAGTGVTGLGLDWTVPETVAVDELAPKVALQGNMDPMRLRTGGAVMDAEIDRIVTRFRGTRHIFNLGHGVTPDVPPEHVGAMVERVRQGELARG